MNKKKFALVSVYKKDKLEHICNLFKKNNIEVISTGSTAKYIRKIGYKCTDVSYFTKFKEMFDGRVKTLHPLIHASLLYDRKNKNHLKTFKKLNFPDICFVVVNLYPFNEAINSNKSIKKSIEMIDIGGTALLRSAAKNFSSVTTISQIADYDIFIENVKKNFGKTSLNFRKKMAMQAFKVTSAYDYLISTWMGSKNNLIFSNHEKKILRYGENPHQKSFFYKNQLGNNLFDNLKTQKKQLSFNNISDISAAYDCLKEFYKPTCVIIKHNTPCGVASHSNLKQAMLKAYESDPISAFGGIMALNRTVDVKICKILKFKFIEIIIAPRYTKESLEILSRKKGLIIINANKIEKDNKVEIKTVRGGYLVQEKNLIIISSKKIKLQSDKKASKKQIADLIFAFKVSKHSKSNAIVLVRNEQTVGICSGQTSRISSTKIAISKTPTIIKKQGFVAASDAFFPFTDSLKLLIKNNCKAIVQPKGSINDKKIVSYAKLKKIPLYFSNYRFFKH